MPLCNIIQSISRLGALSTRISYYSYKIFSHYTYKAQSPDVGSGVCQYIMQGRMPFTRTWFCLRKPFHRRRRRRRRRRREKIGFRNGKYIL